MNYSSIIAEHGKALGATGLAVLVAFNDYPGSTYAEVAAMLNMGESTVRRDAATLERLGLVKREFKESPKGLCEPTKVYPAIRYQGESDKPRQDIAGSITYQGTDPAISERVENTEEIKLSGAPTLSDPAIRYQGTSGTKVAPSKAETTYKKDTQPSVEAGADAPPRKVKKSRPDKPPPDPRSQHAAIQIVRKLMERYPDKLLWDDLIELIGDEPDELRLTKCRKLWLKRNFNRNSTGWTDWYAPGVLEAKEAEYGGNGRAQNGADGNSGNVGQGRTPYAERRATARAAAKRQYDDDSI